MYNPYLPQSWAGREETPPPSTPPAGEKKSGLTGLLKSLKLEDIDTGDVLFHHVVRSLFPLF